jgi:hypothetical protein
MRAASKRKFLRAETIAVGGAGFDQWERLQRLGGGTRVDWTFDVTDREHALPIGIDDRDGAAMAALDASTAHDFDEGWITHC